MRQAGQPRPLPGRSKNTQMLREFIKRFVFHIVYPCCYGIGRLKPLKKKKAVFVQTHGKILSDNFELLYQKMKEEGYDNRIRFLRISDSGWGSIIRRSIGLLFEIADAGVILLDESNSLMGSFRIREGSKVIQLWHACGAFKKWGYSVADKSFGDDAESLMRFSGHRNYSLVTVSGEQICWAYEEAFGLPVGGNIVRPLGVSRTDVFFDRGRRQEAFRKLEGLNLQTEGRQIVAYLPTFRGSIAKAEGAKGFDVQKLLPFRKRYVFLIKNHPFVKEPFEIPASCRDFVTQIGTQMSVEDMLMTADVLITDYSSVIFEFSLMQKPMLFYAYDYDDYDLERGFYYPYRDFVPGKISENMDELTESLKRIDEYDKKKLSDFRTHFMSGCDGHATDRILEFITAS